MARQSVPRGRAAVIGNVRSATVDSRVRRRGNDDVDADRRRDKVMGSISDVHVLEEFSSTRLWSID